MWFKERRKQLEDFSRFGKALILTGDIDPQFWILRSLYSSQKLDKNTAIWRTAVYLVYYHLGSAIKAWDLYPTPEIIKKKDWVEGIYYYKQRRCFRGNNHARDQLNTLLKNSDGDLVRWTEKAVGNGGEEGWTRVREAAANLPYHGPWSSYKWCDLIKFVHGFPITAPDIGTKPGATAGPIAGLSSLTGLDWKRCSEDNSLHRDLLSCIIDMGCPANGLDHLESILCNWQSLINGRYYTGHDIDRDCNQLLGTSGDHSDGLVSARKRIFDKRLLGEVGGWSEVRKNLNSVYRDRGRLVNDFPDIKKVKI